MSLAKRKVIIIGHGYTSRLAVIRSVAQVGCEITVIVLTGKTLNTTRTIDCYSKFVDRILYCIRDSEELIRLLLNECAEQDSKSLIFPDSDFAAFVIDGNLDRLKNYFLIPHIGNKQGAVVNWMNKEKQKELAREVGLNVANSVSMKIDGQNAHIPSSVQYPCFTKTRSYIKGTKQTLKRCNNRKELQDFTNKLSSWFNGTLLVEDYKEIEEEYAVNGFSDGKEVVIPGVIHILSMAGSHHGVASKGEVLPVKGFEELIAKFKEFVLRVGFVGVFDIDFYLSHGEYYFGELNLRIGGSCYAVTKMGVNLPGMLVRHLYGDSIDDMKKEITASATYVNERMLTEDWIFRYISTKEFFGIINSEHISFIKDKEDPKPYKAYIRYVRIKRVRRIVKRLLGRK